MNKHTLRGLVLAATLFTFPAFACDVTSTEFVRVAEVADAVTFELTDGRVLRLEGLGPPRRPARASAQSNEPWRMMDEATAAARRLVTNGALGIAATDAPDRYGRIIAQAFLPDGTWANGALVTAGFARVETTRDQRRCAGEALELEAEARTAQRGMWRFSTYQVRDALEAGAFTNDFQIVEGVVIATAEVRGRMYLNFGDDWHTDFTVTIAPGDRRRFEAAGFDPLSLAGKRIRARGWLEFYNGPMIDADHPEQIEILGEADAGPEMGAEQ